MIAPFVIFQRCNADERSISHLKRNKKEVKEMLNPKDKQDANLIFEELQKMKPEDQIIVTASINALRQRQILEEKKKVKEAS